MMIDKFLVPKKKEKPSEGDGDKQVINITINNYHTVTYNNNVVTHGGSIGDIPDSVANAIVRWSMG